MKRRELVQVTRTSLAGTVEYAFKTIGVRDPLGSDLIWRSTALPVPSGFEAYQMFQSFTGTRGAVGKGRWSQCYVCQEDFPIAEMILDHGKYYCTKNRCNEDLL